VTETSLPQAEPSRPQISTRDRSAVRAGLEQWLRGRRGTAVPTIVDLSAPQNTGMSSDTVLFAVEWRDGDDIDTEHLVARLAPDPDAAPLFPEYDLERQYRVMEAVAEHSSVAVPPRVGYEPDPTFVGTPFLVMERVDGVVPTDIPPYTFGAGWVEDASGEERERMQRASVEVLVGLHAIADPVATFPWLAPTDARTPLRAHVDGERAFRDWVLAGRDGPLIERGFAWLEDHWPDEGPTVLSWGDARIGNLLYRDFTPVAVLDWEMATLGPRELDVAWMIYLHRFFDDLAVRFELPGLPDFLRRDAVVAQYGAQSGHTLRDLDWFTTYAAVRHAVIMTRVGLRQVHFGESEMPADIDDFVTHRSSLEAMLEGHYWETVRT
jgi:aminoglycoside phosphotransferase (APT) family kinase protein